MLQINTDTQKFIKDLSKIQGGMHEASARTINNLAEKTRSRYNKLIQDDFNIRTKYTLNALRMYKATFMRKSKPGELRPLRDINAVLFIKKMKGGKEHYLVIQEEGQNKDKHKTADETVSVPTASFARSGGTMKGRVNPKYNLRKGINNLKIGGKRKAVHDFGTARDGFSNRQRWAILQKYKKTNTYGWDLKSPFRYEWNGQVDAYALKGNNIGIVRLMRAKSLKVKKRPNFKTAFGMINENEMQQIFNTVAGRLLR